MAAPSLCPSQLATAMADASSPIEPDIVVNLQWDEDGVVKSSSVQIREHATLAELKLECARCLAVEFVEPVDFNEDMDGMLLSELGIGWVPRH